MASLTDRVQKIEDKQHEIKSSCNPKAYAEDHDAITKHTQDITNINSDIIENTNKIENLKDDVNAFINTNTQTLTKLNMTLDNIAENQKGIKAANKTRDDNVQNLTTSTNLIAEKVTILFKKSEDSNAFIRSIVKSIITALLIAGLLFIFSSAYKNMQNDTNNLKLTNKQNILPNIQPQYITPTTRTNERTKK